MKTKHVSISDEIKVHPTELHCAMDLPDDGVHNAITITIPVKNHCLSSTVDKSNSSDSSCIVVLTLSIVHEFHLHNSRWIALYPSKPFDLHRNVCNSIRISCGVHSNGRDEPGLPCGTDETELPLIGLVCPARILLTL
jgi:hypothetical protein